MPQLPTLRHRLRRMLTRRGFGWGAVERSTSSFSAPRHRKSWRPLGVILLPFVLGDAAFAISTIVRGTSGFAGRSIIVEGRGPGDGLVWRGQLRSYHRGPCWRSDRHGCLASWKKSTGTSLLLEVLLPRHRWSSWVPATIRRLWPTLWRRTSVWRVTMVDHRSFHLRAITIPRRTRLVEAAPRLSAVGSPTRRADLCGRQDAFAGVGPGMGEATAEHSCAYIGLLAHVRGPRKRSASSVPTTTTGCSVQLD